MKNMNNEDADLVGTTLNVFWCTLKTGNPVGMREV
jgi:hypothetical protein